MPSLSPEAIEALKLLDSDSADVPTLVKAVSLDPVLSATLVRYANAPGRRGAREVDSVQAAISRLGLRCVRGAVMVAAMRGLTDQGHPVARVLWEQAMVVSTLARSLAQRSARALADTAELVGMMHNIGAQVMVANFPQPYQEVIDHAATEGMLIRVAEKARFGFHRGELMVALAERFRLPPLVTSVLGRYHDGQLPGVGGDDDLLLSILWLAQITACRSNISSQWPNEYLPENVDALVQGLGVDEDVMLDLAEDCDLLLNERFSF
jgi:HD-like signal output (HDOD) protein